MWRTTVGFHETETEPSCSSDAVWKAVRATERLTASSDVREPSGTTISGVAVSPPGTSARHLGVASRSAVFSKSGESASSASRLSSELPAPIRILIAKPGLDGHDRGAKIIARALRDAGMEVIYTGLHQTPEQIVETAIQEDADAVGISILSGAHMTLVPRILHGLRQNGADDVLVVVGGTIPAEDARALKDAGVAEVFTPGAPTSEIVDFLREKVTG